MTTMLHQSSAWKKLTLFSIRWYFHVVREMLIKYKVVSIFLVCLLAPTWMSVVNLAKMPAETYLYSSEKAIIPFTVVLLFIQLLSIFIGVLHRPVLTGRKWDGYIKSLAMSAVQRRIVDSIVLMLANALFMLTIFYSYASHIFSSEVHFFEGTGRFLFLIMMMLSIELSVIYQERSKLLVSIVLGSLLIIAMRFSSPIINALLPWVQSYLLYRMCYWVNSEKTKIIKRGYLLTNTIKVSSSLFLSLILLNLKLLFNDGKANLVRLLPIFIVGIVCAILASMKGVSNNAMTTIFLVAILANAFFVSNLYRPIYLQWQQYQQFCSSLPLSPIYFLMSILMVGLMLAFPVSLIEGFIFHGIIENYFYVVMLWLLYLLLSFGLQIKLRRYGLIFSLVLILPFFFALKAVS